MSSHHFPAEYFQRHDEGNDALFYDGRRQQFALDEGAAAELAAFFREHLPQGGIYLDLMSGRRSYLPDELRPARVVGLGLASQGMAQNERLDAFRVLDVNEHPHLPFDDDHFDATLCTASIQYLTRPVELFRQVNRVLKPGGVFFISFSSGCFPEKAIAIWLIATTGQRMALVRQYFQASGNWSDIKSWERPGAGNAGGQITPLNVVWARKPVPD